MDIEGKQQKQEEEYKSEDQTSYFLQCKVCRDQYDEKLKKPLILPCGHTFCQFCIDYLTQDGIVVCPLDKKTCEVSDKLIINYAIIEALNEQANLNIDILYCKKHPKEIIKFYCEDDKQNICQECLLETHLGHHIKPAEEYVDMKKLQLNAENFLQGLETNQKKFLEMKEQIEEEYQENTEQIDLCKENMLSEFNQAYKESINSLKTKNNELQTSQAQKMEQMQQLFKEGNEILARIKEPQQETKIIEEVENLYNLLFLFKGKKIKKINQRSSRPC